MYRYNLLRCTYVRASITLQQSMAGSWSTFPLMISNRPRYENKAHIAPTLVKTTSPLSIYRFISTIGTCPYHICYNPRPLGTQHLNALEYVHHYLQLLQLRVDHHKHTTPTRTIPVQQKQQWY